VKALQRGGIVLVDLDPNRGHEQAGKRPALIVSSNRVNEIASGLVTVLPITRTRRNLRSYIHIEAPEGGLREDSWVIGEQIRTISTQRILRVWGQVTVETMQSVDEVLRWLLELQDLGGESDS
jgi:mRNA interferase MazF